MFGAGVVDVGVFVFPGEGERDEAITLTLSTLSFSTVFLPSPSILSLEV